ncbi:MAG: nucleotide-binding protein, partial [Chloroflexi bacterium]|nr:nucleotide-binding protein [Chloroflexota bacterium]
MIKTAENKVNQHFFNDTFQADKPPGGVIGSTTQSGVRRLGVDVEQVMRIDNGALRIQPLVRPGWGRAGVAYGPFQRENGLAFAVSMLNGHNTSQTGHLNQSTVRRVGRWLLGHPADVLGKRIMAWGRNGHKKRLANQLRRWVWWNRKFRNGHQAAIDENLTVGWFSQDWQGDPFTGGNAFVMHALDAENGELWTQVGSAFLPAVRGVQNVPIYYLVVLRETGAAYYVASLPNVPGMASYPLLRPVGIDAFQTEPAVFAGVHQSVMGQIGFWVDSRVYSTQVHRVAEMNQWYGSAHAADRLSTAVSLAGECAEVGGRWRALP